jgi:hypothetical protein
MKGQNFALLIRAEPFFSLLVRKPEFAGLARTWVAAFVNSFDSCPESLQALLIPLFGEAIASNLVTGEDRDRIVMMVFGLMSSTGSLRFQFVIVYFITQVIRAAPEYLPGLLEGGIVELIHGWLTAQPRAEDDLGDNVAQFFMNVFLVSENADEGLLTWAFGRIPPLDRGDGKVVARLLVGLAERIERVSDAVKIQFLIAVGRLISLPAVRQLELALKRPMVQQLIAILQTCMLAHPEWRDQVQESAGDTVAKSQKLASILFS